MKEPAKQYLVVYYDNENNSLGESTVYSEEEIKDYLLPGDFLFLQENRRILISANPSWITEYGIYSFTVEEIKI